MPRSGTTLVEQVLASHPAVHGGGELTTLADIVREQAGLRSCTYPRVLADLEAAEVSALGAEYVRRLRALAPGALRVTDKMPGNFRFLGLIRLALPGARIIHCRRNPVDTCLSCYQQNFHEGHAFTNDLTDLGRYYRAYARLMEQWRRIFPGQFLEVDYEGLVTDFERESRRMLEFAGLPWDDACLRFHQTPRSVDTASRWQVRQPLYRRSVERRRNYERHLGPLREALGDAAGG